MTLRLVILACTVALVSWLWVRGTDNPSSLGPAPQLSSPATCPNNRGAQSLARLLAFQTVSAANETEHLSEASIAAYEAMLESLEQELFPQVFTGGKLEVERVNNYSLLLTWNGSKPDLKPVLFVSHLDVVPATDVSAWTHGPFDAHVNKDGFLYGRGALDVKFSAAAILEAVTALLDQGYQPERTIMFGLGHDEEVGGEQGAGATAALLASRGIELEVVIDEGGLVMRDGLKPFTSQPVALVGTAEKGYVSAGVVLKTSGGHSSMPPTDGSDAHSVVLRYLAAVRRRQPGPGLKPPLTDMLDALQPYTRKPIILALMHLKNTWPFNHLVAHLMARGGREASAMVRTSLALTGMMGYVANNVLPPSVSLRFNARLYPGTPATAITDMLSAAAADSGVSAEVSMVERVWPAAGVTDSKGRHFNLLRQAIQAEWVYDGQPVPVVPFLLTGGTDSKHYAPLSRHGVLRFVPFDLSKSGGDLARIHGVDERVHEDTFTRAVCTYKRMLELFGQLGEAL